MTPETFLPATLRGRIRQGPPECHGDLLRLMASCMESPTEDIHFGGTG